MNIAALREHLCATYPDLCPLFSIEFGDGVLSVDPDRLLEAAGNLKDLGFDRLSVVTAVDRPTHFELVYRLYARPMSAAVFIKCNVDRENPRVHSLAGLWPAALWQERETFDMFGIIFEGHPDLRRILLPDDWEGYPLRKDYQDETLIRRPDYI
ncbi:MAG: NADH-quinone oxidoreductase subunit C [Anaerosomatales bacterium]|nr:NADH-quinone oxidoreductase subunit C [Anaerosomatales bacterium]MDT8433500.1 NADH-quinone oxidoreductase subunit C [Anaerosomatales bacterium]